MLSLDREESKSNMFESKGCREIKMFPPCSLNKFKPFDKFARQLSQQMSVIGQNGERMREDG